MKKGSKVLLPITLILLVSAVALYVIQFKSVFTNELTELVESCFTMFSKTGSKKWITYGVSGALLLLILLTSVWSCINRRKDKVSYNQFFLGSFLINIFACFLFFDKLKGYLKLDYLLDNILLMVSLVVYALHLILLLVMSFISNKKADKSKAAYKSLKPFIYIMFILFSLVFILSAFINVVGIEQVGSVTRTLFDYIFKFKENWIAPRPKTVVFTVIAVMIVIGMLVSVIRRKRNVLPVIGTLFGVILVYGMVVYKDFIQYLVILNLSDNTINAVMCFVSVISLILFEAFVVYCLVETVMSLFDNDSNLKTRMTEHQAKGLQSLLYEIENPVDEVDTIDDEEDEEDELEAEPTNEDSQTEEESSDEEDEEDEEPLEEPKEEPKETKPASKVYDEEDEEDDPDAYDDEEDEDDDDDWEEEEDEEDEDVSLDEDDDIVLDDEEDDASTREALKRRRELIRQRILAARASGEEDEEDEEIEDEPVDEVVEEESIYEDEDVVEEESIYEDEDVEEESIYDDEEDEESYEDFDEEESYEEDEEDEDEISDVYDESIKYDDVEDEEELDDDDDEEDEEDEEALEESEENDETPLDDKAIKKPLFIKSKPKPLKNKLIDMDDEKKERYNTVRNALQSYKLVRERLSSKGDSYRFHGDLIAKMSISGKTLRLHLALNPADFENSKYSVVDLSNKSKYVYTPLTIRLRSKRSVKHALELIEMLGEAFGLEKNPKYKEQDYMNQIEIMIATEEKSKE